MPVMSGLEVCKKVRDANLNRYIIFLTAKDDALDIEEGVETGADDYICKPFRQEELNIRIRAAMRIIHLEEKLDMPHDKACQEMIELQYRL
ncbi:MAG: DNA-binding response OmpR family regulator [Alphaproteobacteria bacterium]|jgi:DNA-binding response OmpR family regulator